ICCYNALTIRRLKLKAVVPIPANPAMPQRQRHAKRIKPLKPCTQQGRRLERFRKHAAARSDESRLSEIVGPLSQRLGRERVDGGLR
ncbi:MAG: hypothetical protein K0Q64_2407, partial [Nitrobacter vulgaris]|nr:hypothetical protein [Nitrobacter vulgaris]